MELRDCVKGDPRFVALWHKICADSDNEKELWIKNLKAAGFKAAHPNDGWIDRKNNTLQLTYPQFNLGADVGDLVMLGWPSDKPEKLRPVRLTEKIESVLGYEKFSFIDAEFD